MSINIETVVTSKIDNVVKGDLLAMTEVYDKRRIRELIEKYGNEDKIACEDTKVCIKEYADGIKHMIINGTIMDEGENTTDIEEHIVIKNDTNLFGYSKSTTYVSYLHLLNPHLKNNDLLPGRDKIVRDRFKMYIDGKKRVGLETYREDGNNKVIYERFTSYDKDGKEKKINLFYDVLENAIYGEIGGSGVQDSKASDNTCFVKDMMVLAGLEIEDSLVSESVLKKK